MSYVELVSVGSLVSVMVTAVPEYRSSRSPRSREKVFLTSYSGTRRNIVRPEYSVVPESNLKSSMSIFSTAFVVTIGPLEARLPIWSV
jgi:hypothetical protein